MITKDNCSTAAISILELIEQLKFYEDWRVGTKYQITENFADAKHIYNLMNLTAEKEDEYIIFDDGEGILEENDIYALNMLLISSVKEITYSINELKKRFQASLRLNRGNIEIIAILD